MVDNASTDDTEKVLAAYADRPTVSIERLTENTGGAGGFSRGMSLAYERGADFVWIMDDDCYADPTALGELLDGHAAAEKSMGMRLPYTCSVVRWTDGDICEMNNPEPTWDWGRLLVRGESSVLVNSCSFVSVLFPAGALRVRPARWPSTSSGSTTRSTPAGSPRPVPASRSCAAR